jgi:hypothetical protein
MWELRDPKPVKLIAGILAANEGCLPAAVDALTDELGPIDLRSDVWPFDQTDYYQQQTGPAILRQFVSFEALIDPGELAAAKLATNDVERKLAESLDLPVPRPINLDPGLIETAKLVLATTKNYSHRIYIGQKMFAEVTLIYDKGHWKPFEYTYPDYQQQCYHDFFTKVRDKLLLQLRSPQ